MTQMLIHGNLPLRGSVTISGHTSVGATINLLLAAVLADGVTRIRNSAREPHVCNGFATVERGYERMDEKLQALGAQVQRISPDNDLKDFFEPDYRLMESVI